MEGAQGRICAGVCAVANVDLRRIAERTYTSAVDAAKVEDHQVVVVMAAATVEAFLLDFLERKLLGKLLGALLDGARPFERRRPTTSQSSSTTKGIEFILAAP